MFPRRFFPGRMFAPRFFPQSQGDAPPVEADTPGGVFRRRGDLSRVFRPHGEPARVFRRRGDPSRVFRANAPR